MPLNVLLQPSSAFLEQKYSPLLDERPALRSLADSHNEPVLRWFRYRESLSAGLGCRISFTTPADRRAALVEEAKALYSEFCQKLETINSDRINRMDGMNSNPVNPVHPVQNAISSRCAPDSQKFLYFVGVRLSAAPEESDVVHDLLAYLAERMIEMNKEKNCEK